VRINTEHEKAAVKLARDRGEVCPWCRSAEFLAIADSRPQPYQDGSADLRMECGRVPHPYPAPEQPWSVKLSAADLQKIGIVAR